jgi:hypothetical protein
MPFSGLDPSWKFGMNQAMAQGFSFGQEIIFTFGPYASIYTKMYHPATDFMMMSGSLYLALSYWICLIFLTKDVRWPWLLAFCTILVVMRYLPDTLLFSFPLLVGLASFKITSSQYKISVKSKATIFYFALLFAPFGLLPLIKGPLIILCGTIVFLSGAFFIANKHRVLAITCLISPTVSMMLFWLAAGQAVISLPHYFIAMIPIIFGYTEAMALQGSMSQVILYLFASAFLLFSIILQKPLSTTTKIFLFGIYFVFLFLSFKAGFVRHDGHAVISGSSILIAALSLSFIFNTRIIFFVIVFALIAGGYAVNRYHTTSIRQMANDYKTIYLSAWNGFKNRIKYKSWPKSDFDAAVKSLKYQAAFPVLLGTTDIYSYNQSYLISSGNIWSPRPILQSYSVYTPLLAEENKKHLLGVKAPSNIIFKVEPIDGRIPSIEDGASWPVLLANYQPIQVVNDFLLLRKKENSSEIVESLKLKSEKYFFGENVDLPFSDYPIFIYLDIRKTFFGRLASILFKSGQLQITLELKNGTKRQYRMIADMAKSGFLISPLIENTAEFGMLYNKRGYLNGKLVKSFAITPRGGKTLTWDNEYTVIFSHIKVNPLNNLPKLYKFNE